MTAAALFLTVALVLPTSIGPAAVQDALEEAKAQYAAAAYEEALSSLDRAGTATPATQVEVEQYRAFCLIALGRTADAERTIATLIALNPRYQPSESVASPRVLAMVTDMRRKELPAVARRLLDEGRAAFTEKQMARARDSFTLLLQVLSDPAMRDRPEAVDMRALAEGFSTLTDAVAEPGDAPATPAASAASAAPIQADTVTEAVAVQQSVPVWVPPNAMVALRGYTGAIKVRIGVDGRVKSAVIERPTYPSYDAQLVHATRQWLYTPATRNGSAIESDKIVSFQLLPK